MTNLLMDDTNELENSCKFKGTYFEHFLVPIIATNNNKMLRRKLRVTIRSFKYIVALLKESNAFRFWKTHNTDNPKYHSVEKQTALFLFFLSRNYLYHDISDVFGLGSASVVCTILERVSQGILEYKMVYINGHSDESMTEQLENANHYGFTNCIGIIDGVVNKITSFDKVYTHSWTTRKSIYGMVSMVICDTLGRIVWYSTGICGSRNDRGIFKDDVLPIINNLTNCISLLSSWAILFIRG